MAPGEPDGAPAPPGDGAMSVNEIEWTDEARARVEHAPPFVRAGILKLMPIRARERGRTVIDSEFLTEIRNESMLRAAQCIRRFGFEELSIDAFDVAKTKMRRLPRKVAVIDDIKQLLAERVAPNEFIVTKFRRYLEMIPRQGVPWTEEALDRIEGVPAAVREELRQAATAAARNRREAVVTPEAVDAAMQHATPRPTSPEPAAPGNGGPLPGTAMPWDAAAEDRLRRIPLAPIRNLVAQRVEAYAVAQGLTVVDVAAFEAAAPRPPFAGSSGAGPGDTR